MTIYQEHDFNLSRHRGTVNLYLWGDFHVGHRDVFKTGLFTVLDRIRRERCYWVGMGDYGNCTIPGSDYYNPATLDTEYATPDKQYKYVTEILDPIKKKCLGLLAGNHDLRFKQKGHDYVDILAWQLDAKYLSYDCYYRFHFIGPHGQRRDMDCYFHHGHGGGKRTGSKINNLEDMMLIFDPSPTLFAMGHTHCLGPSPFLYPIRVNRELKPIAQQKYFISTGGFLKGYDPGESTYVSRKALKPLGVGAIKLTIQPFANVSHCNEHGDRWNTDELKIRVQEVP